MNILMLRNQMKINDGYSNTSVRIVDNSNFLSFPSEAVIDMVRKCLYVYEGTGVFFTP